MRVELRIFDPGLRPNPAIEATRTGHSKGAAMIEGTFVPLHFRVLVVDDELTHDTAEGRSARSLVADLKARNLDVIQAISAADGMAVVTSDAALHAILMDWTLDDDDAKTHAKAKA